MVLVLALHLTGVWGWGLSNVQTYEAPLGYPACE